MRLPMRLSKLKLNLRMKLPKLDLRTRLPKLKLDLSHENFFKLTMVFWILQFLLVGYLFATSGWLGKVGVILIGWALFEANRRTFFKKIELKEKEYKEALIINTWTGLPIKVMPPEKIFFIFPIAEKVIELDVTLQQASEDIFGMPEGVEIKTKATIPFQPDTKNIMRYFQAGNVASLITATAQEVFKNSVSDLKLKDALTETSLISSLLEAHLTKGPLRICFEKISALWQLMKKGESEWEKEIRKSEGKFIETPEGRAKRAEIRERMPVFWTEVRRFISEVAKNLIVSQEERKVDLASEEICREIETFINQIYEMGKDIEIMEERMEALITEERLKKIEEITKEKGRIQEILEEVAECPPEEKKWRLKGKLKKEIEERLEKSELEKLLATKISSPLISAVEPTAEEIKNSIRSLTSAGFRKQMLDEYARQKNITIQKFIEAMRKLEVKPDKQLTPKDIFDALLIDAERVKKTQFEIPGLKEALIEVGKAVANALALRKFSSSRKSKEVK